ncbi:hypothetical protein BJV78DRAFT_577835 [Lactifluus subvellereus]|nr:hypothetical protein BJV78DRAFT_577835 [Lactifluus subvellereus]
MAHYDIFREELATKYSAYGYALWEPSPGELYDRVEVGDVGYIRAGKFHRLFNVFLPKDHPSHANFGTPEYHKPLQLKMSRHIDTGTLGPNDLYSAEVSVVSGGFSQFASAPEGAAQVSFACSRKQGAVLSLPVPARREDTVAQGDFGRWMVKHIDRWFAFTRLLGLGLGRMEDIILVTGCHRARSWTNATFSESQGGVEVSFGVQVTNAAAGVDIEWQMSREYTHGAMLNRGPSGMVRRAHSA